MSAALFLLWLGGCTWISGGEWLQAADRDGDGYAAAEAGGDDCDDADPSVHPGAAETCDGRDEDCDGAIDEDLESEQPWYPDADGDGYGVPGEPVTACAAPAGYGDGQDDCDDASATAYPGATEVLDGADQDCDGVVDDLILPESADWTLWEGVGHPSFARADFGGDGHADLVAVLPRGSEGLGVIGLWWGGSLALSGEDDPSTWQPDLLLTGSEVATATWGLRALPGDGALDGGSDTLVLANDDAGVAVCYLHFGEGLPPSGSLDASLPDVTLSSCGDHQPSRLAWGGDLNGDGFADLPALPEGEASLPILAGRSSAHWNRLDGQDIRDEAELTVDTSALPTPLWVRLEVDLDGDGLDDLLVGAPAPGGACLVAYGREDLLAGDTTLTFPADADAAFAGENLGAPVLGAEDLDGDGRAELLAGDCGQARVYVFVPDTARWSGTLDPEEEALATWNGSPGSLDLDDSLSAGPDVDGDGAPDILVGGARDTNAWLVTGPPEAGSFDLDDLASATIAGLYDGEGVTLARDLDGDGSGEVLLTDAYRGVLYLLYGYR
jgi:hypothetical protein